MNKIPQMVEQTPEKHTLPHQSTCLIDKNGKIVWTSADPLNRSGFAGSAIVDTVPDEHRERIIGALSRCFFSNETVRYDVLGDPPLDCPDRSRKVTWRVVMLPIRERSELAGVCLCKVLPEYHAEITEGESAILSMLCDDKTLKEIAEKMFLSESAIDSKIRHLKDKVGVKTIAGLVAQAVSKFLV